MGMYDMDSNDEAWHLLRKVFLVLLVVIASALGLVLLARRGHNVPLVLFNILADTSLGMLAGLATRFALRDRHASIRWLTSAALSLVGLAILGYLTGWRSGIGPFQAGYVPVHWLDAARIRLALPLEFNRSAMDMLDLMHALIAMDVSWMALRAWRPRTIAASPASALLPAPAPRVRRPARVSPGAAASAPAESVPARHIPTSSPSQPRSRVKRRKADRPVIGRPAPAIRPMRAKAHRSGSLRHNQPAVRLAVHEEHRCPFCLEPVNRNDARGVVECQVCHTLHHKDCWDITGSCQVPHLNT
jgi:hypothetical protein